MITASLLTICMLLMLTQCRAVRTLNAIRTSKLEIDVLSQDEKEVYFFSMIHVGKADFYKKVREHIKKLKQDGAVLFYEQIKGSDELSVKDSLKFAKIKGELGKSEDYKKIFEEELGWKLEGQDNDSFLNIVNSKDYNVDLNVKEIYGALHKKGLLKELKKVNKNWKITNSYNASF